MSSYLYSVAQVSRERRRFGDAPRHVKVWTSLECTPTSKPSTSSKHNKSFLSFATGRQDTIPPSQLLSINIVGVPKADDPKPHKHKRTRSIYCLSPTMDEVLLARPPADDMMLPAALFRLSRPPGTGAEGGAPWIRLTVGFEGRLSWGRVVSRYRV